MKCEINATNLVPTDISNSTIRQPRIQQHAHHSNPRRRAYSVDSQPCSPSQIALRLQAEQKTDNQPMQAHRSRSLAEDPSPQPPLPRLLLRQTTAHENATKTASTSINTVANGNRATPSTSTQDAASYSNKLKEAGFNEKDLAPIKKISALKLLCDLITSLKLNQDKTRSDLLKKTILNYAPYGLKALCDAGDRLENKGGLKQACNKILDSLHKQMNEFLSEPNPWEEFLADLKVHKLYKALLKASNIALIKNIIINSWIDRRINSFEKGILKKSQSGPVNWDGEVGSFLLKTST